MGRLAGLWHDAGKYRKAFQQRIGVDPDAHTNQTVDHSTVGALIARNSGAHPLAFIVAGHHGGLCDRPDLLSRLASKKTLLDEARSDGLPPELEKAPLPETPTFIGSDTRKLALWVRLVFSALVDADYLDTERFYKEAERETQAPTLAQLLKTLDAHLAEKCARAESTVINAMRARVLNACGEAALLAPGAFTLTVPTGGGKTLSSLLFAMKHAVYHGLRRVIVVIPFTSIIEQTADEYRKVLGAEAVIEHHSGLDPEQESRFNRLACENWDAPLVVTTSVQFFESFYASRTSACRKLHRIPESVVIVDEVQTFPTHLLKAICDRMGRVAGIEGRRASRRRVD